MQKYKPQIYPLITKLRNMDFWYWCTYYIDLYRNCPYRCSYCNTQKKTHFTGLNFIQGLPEEKETIGLGLISDIYSPNPSENTIVTDILNYLRKGGYPVNIQTKSDQIIHDIDILKKLADRDHLRVTFTILTLDQNLSQKLEGLSPGPIERLESIKILKNEGISTGISISPVIPYINDDKESITNLILQCKKAGADWVLFSGFTMINRFRTNPLWKATQDIHLNQKKLQARYKRTKKLLLSLLHRERLPIRIPRITLNRWRTSQQVSEYLFNISYLQELLENEIQMLRYRRAAYEIENLAVSLKTIVSSKKLGFIKGINPELERVIEENIYDGTPTLYAQLYQQLLS